MTALSKETLVADLALISAARVEEEAFIRKAHFDGAGGNEIVQRRTALIDRTLKDIWHLYAASSPPPALVAVGGYGRGELNPHSDIDIMLLCRDERQRQRASPLLYAFWDASLDIGYSVRTTAECIDLSRRDPKIRTTLMESRLIAGDGELYRSYLHRLQTEVLRRRTSQFIADKISERRATRQKFGGSLYLREPNIKESTGGLRDVHLAKWIAMTRFGVTGIDELVPAGVISAGDLAVFSRARNFLWRVRNELHYCSDRKNDQLTYDQQEFAARDFRYRDSAHLMAVERFMKAYFLHARTIRQFTRMISERSLPARTRSWIGIARPVGPFTVMGKVLFPTKEEDLQQRPERVLQAFSIAHARAYRFSDRLLQLVRNSRMDDTARSAPESASSFLDILNAPDGLADTLTLMRDLRVLGRYLPEFRAVQGLARHDYYHLYTVDEHILTAVRCLEQLWNGNHPSLDTLLAAFRSLRKRWVLMLAVLLHDLGKAFREDHERHGADIARGVLDRLGVTGEDRERILFLVGHHVLMSVLSQRRELTDRNVIAEFGRTVGDRENLDMLYLLTFADMSAVGPSAWSAWKASLLQELYLRTAAWIEQRGEEAEDVRARGKRQAALVREAAAGRFPERQVDDVLAAMPVHYLLTTPVMTMLEHIEWMGRLPSEQLVIRHRNLPERGCTELTVCAYDDYGMFYRTAGTIAAQNLSIRRAKVYTARNGIMIDTFEITGAEGGMVPHDEVWTAVAAELREVLGGERRPSEARISAYERPLPGAVRPSVSFDNDASDFLTIIDMTARDRVGLLYRITKTLFDLNIDIASAKIVTEGIRIMDSFYVSDLLGKKITDPERLGKVRDALLKVLG